MHLRKIAVGLSALVLLSSGAQARSLLDFIKPPAQHQENTSHSGSISQGAALDLYSNKQKQASFDGCADLFPAAKPITMAAVPATMKPMALCSDNFAVLYSQTSKTPLVVVERLNAALLRDAKGEERTNQFYPDPRIPKDGRAELSDYRSQHPAVDRGHQSPAADAPTPNAMAQSFALSNMVPQAPENNRGVWARRVEAATRHYVMRAQGDVYVFTGPAFEGQLTTIGSGHVWVPTHLFKLVYDPNAQRAWAYWVENKDDAAVTKPISYRELVNHIGIELLPGIQLKG